MKKTYMKCSVCGAFAGHYQQHPNCDTGWGICAPCVATQSGREEPEEMARLYGKAGVHFEQPTHVVYGRRYKVLATFTDTDKGTDKANAYMLRNPAAAVLAVADGEVVLTDLADKGVTA